MLSKRLAPQSIISVDNLCFCLQCQKERNLQNTLQKLPKGELSFFLIISHSEQVNNYILLTTHRTVAHTVSLLSWDLCALKWFTHYLLLLYQWWARINIISASVSWFFFTVLFLYSAPHTFISPLSSCLIKTLTVGAGAVIHVIAEDNPVISQWCLQQGQCST